MAVFPKDKLTQIKLAIDQALMKGAAPIAAFDADGTLWNMDMGEYFFDYQIRKKLLSDLPPDPWNTYWTMQKEDAPRAYLWLAQINKGRSLADVRKWAQEAFAEIKQVPVFHSMHEVIRHLQASAVKVYVVTASIKWAVEPGAEFLGIPQDNVIGITTRVSGGVITDALEGVVTWREGKVTGLMNATGAPPFFAAGNTLGDLALLEAATHLRLVNCAAPKNHHNHTTEQKLVEIAKSRGWFHHSY